MVGVRCGFWCFQGPLAAKEGSATAVVEGAVLEYGGVTVEEGGEVGVKVVCRRFSRERRMRSVKDLCHIQALCMYLRQVK